MSHHFDPEKAANAGIKAIGIGLYSGEKRTGAVWQLSSRGGRFPTVEEIVSLVSGALTSHRERVDSIEIYTRTSSRDQLEDRLDAPVDIVATAMAIWHGQYQFVVGRMQEKCQLKFSFTFIATDGCEATRDWHSTNGIYPYPLGRDLTRMVKEAAAELGGEQLTLRYSIIGPRDLQREGTRENLEPRSLIKAVFGGWRECELFWQYESPTKVLRDL